LRGGGNDDYLDGQAGPNELWAGAGSDPGLGHIQRTDGMYSTAYLDGLTPRLRPGWRTRSSPATERPCGYGLLGAARGRRG
jgi:hypothetical protein